MEKEDLGLIFLKDYHFAGFTKFELCNQEPLPNIVILLLAYMVMWIRTLNHVTTYTLYSLCFIAFFPQLSFSF